MKSRARLFGRPISLFVVIIPLCLFLAVILLDLFYLSTGNKGFATLSFYGIALGVLGGVLAGAFGIKDFWTIPSKTKVKRIAAWHLFGNLMVILLYALSWLTRATSDPGHPPFLAVALSITGLLIGMITAWLVGNQADLPEESAVPVKKRAVPGSLSDRLDTLSRMSMHQVPVTGRKSTREKPE
jgi:uncharacterized membrane protein